MMAGMKMGFLEVSPIRPTCQVPDEISERRRMTTQVWARVDKLPQIWAGTACCQQVRQCCLITPGSLMPEAQAPQ